VTALRALRDVTVELWRALPDLLTPWLERLTDDLNRWTGKHR
jgi:hypothetical protein